MHDRQNALSGVGKSAQRPHQLKLAGDIQIGRRLVKQNIVGVLRQRHRDIRLLPHTARKLGQRPFGKVLYPHLRHRPARRLNVARAVSARIAKMREPSVQHHLSYRHAGNAFPLCQIGHLFRDVPPRHFAGVCPVDEYSAAGGADDSRCRLQQRALSRTVRADQ